MAEAVASKVARTEDFSTSDRVVALLLAQVADVTAANAVRKTTLAALLAAVEEQIGEDLLDAEAYRSVLTPLSGSGLTDALLHLRNQGFLKLTDGGFQLTEPGASLVRQPEVERLTEFLKGLVSQKFQEWKVVTA